MRHQQSKTGLKLRGPQVRVLDEAPDAGFSFQCTGTFWEMKIGENVKKVCMKLQGCSWLVDDELVLHMDSYRPRFAQLTNLSVEK